MDKKELAFSKHALTTVTDWDDFQRMIRVLVRIARGVDLQHAESVRESR